MVYDVIKRTFQIAIEDSRIRALGSEQGIYYPPSIHDSRDILIFYIIFCLLNKLNVERALWWACVVNELADRSRIVNLLGCV